MSTGHDNFDDRQMAELLRGWGQQAARGRFFAPPADLSPIHTRAAELTEQDIEGAYDTRSLHRRGRLPRILAIAASLFLIAGSWFAWSRLGPPSPPEAGEQLVLSKLRMSASESILRGAVRDRFRGGEELYLHFVADRPGVAFVALLDTQNRLVPVTGESSLIVTRGPNVFGSFVLDEEIGNETALVLASGDSPSTAEFREAIAWANSTIARHASDHDERLEAIVAGLRGRTGWSIQVLGYTHVAP